MPRSQGSSPRNILLALVLLLAGRMAAAQIDPGAFGEGLSGPPGDTASGEPAKAARAEVLLERLRVAAGTELRIAIIIEIKKGWHLYHEDLGPPDAVGMPTTVTLSAEGFAFGDIRFPDPEKIPQPGLGRDGRDTWIWGHHGKIVLFAMGKAAEDAPEGKRKLVVEIQGLTCEEEKGSCVPYSETLSADLEVGSESSPPRRADVFSTFPESLTAQPAATSSPSPRKDGEPDREVGEATLSESEIAEFVGAYTVQNAEAPHSLFIYILLGFIAGVILNFMPCVLPVISIKVLSFVQQAGEDPRRVFRLGLTFAGGILSVFVVLACLATFAGQGWGEQFQSQEFLVIMIAVVFGFSLSLFGVYEIGVPPSVGQLGEGMQREGFADAFFKGVMATVLATPCSGPFLGSTLAWALTQPGVVIFSIFISIGVGMACPYILLTARPGWLKALPRPGPWMETFKHVMGFVLLLTVIYLMVSLEQQRLLFAVTFLLFVAIAAWAYGRYGGFQHGLARRLAALGIAGLVVAAGAWWSFDVFQGMFRPRSDGIEWVEFEPSHLRELHAKGTTVLVDWTADWCPNCKFVEKFVLESEDVRRLIEKKGVVTMKADITHDNPRTRVMTALRDRLGSKSIPFLAIFPGNDPFSPFILRDVYLRSDVTGILDTVPGAAPEGS